MVGQLPFLFESSHQVLFPPGSIFRVLGFYPCNSQSLRPGFPLRYHCPGWLIYRSGKKLGNTRPGKHTTRRRMARERRGAESSVVSMETLYYKII